MTHDDDPINNNVPDIRLDDVESLSVPETADAADDAEGNDENVLHENGSGEDDGESADSGDAEPLDGDGAEVPAPDGAVSFPLTAIVEAILFAARESLPDKKLARLVRKGTKRDDVRRAIDELNLHYVETGRAFEIAEIAGRFQLMSRPEYAPYVAPLHPQSGQGDGETRKLTPSALETLAVVAYQQPVTRAEIEKVRGVGCAPSLKTLQERGLIRITGRAEVIGQPLLWGTTEAFLREFGLGSLMELPQLPELRERGRSLASEGEGDGDSVLLPVNSGVAASDADGASLAGVVLSSEVVVIEGEKDDDLDDDDENGDAEEIDEDGEDDGEDLDDEEDSDDDEFDDDDDDDDEDEDEDIDDEDEDEGDLEDEDDDGDGEDLDNEEDSEDDLDIKPSS